MKKLKSRRGGILVEASLIYPMIIAVTLILLSISLYFYNMTALLSDMERAARREAGVRSGTVFYGAEVSGSSSSFGLSIDDGLLTDTVKAEKTGRFTEHVIFSAYKEHVIAAEASVICEVEKLRNREIIGDVMGNITG